MLDLRLILLGNAQRKAPTPYNKNRGIVPCHAVPISMLMPPNADDAMQYSQSKLRTMPPIITIHHHGQSLGVFHPNRTPNLRQKFGGLLPPGFQQTHV